MASDLDAAKPHSGPTKSRRDDGLLRLVESVHDHRQLCPWAAGVGGTNKGLIQLNLCHKTIDSLWSRFFHEMAHVPKHGKRSVFVDTENERGDEQEEEADRFAADLVERHIQDDTPPGDPHPRTIVYEAPFDPCHREQDYVVAWAEFERRFAHQGALS